MRLVRFGRSDLKVSEVCLGTMTWGAQNTASEAEDQLNYAVHARGINFIDTAELYPVPTTSSTYRRGSTETILGDWLTKQDTNTRNNLIIATKICGYSSRGTPGRSTGCLSRSDIHDGITGSLERLKVDTIDLYQIHWPSRYVPMFGSRQYLYEYERKGMSSIRETLLGLKDGMNMGKIKYYGLSNETTFGVCEWIKLADEMGISRPISIQNSFCLLDRSFESELAEACSPSHFDIPLMPWSVLAGGMLSGKYLDSQRNKYRLEKARYTLYPKFQERYTWRSAKEATEKYKRVADEAGISLATLAQAWCRTRWFIPSTIVAATTMEQLRENIDAVEKVALDKKILRAIDDIHSERPNPCVGL